MQTTMINSASPFKFTVEKPAVDDIDTSVFISAQNTETGDIYRGKTNGWECVIPSFDIYQMCIDGCSWTNDNSKMTAEYECHNDRIILTFNIKTYGIRAMNFSAVLELVENPRYLLDDITADIDNVQAHMRQMNTLLGSIANMIEKLSKNKSNQ